MGPVEASPFVTAQSAVERPFYVLVDQQLMANGEACLELCEGDIFLVTKYNKVGYWWGVSVYDLERQGWFPSTFVQPYTGEVPAEAEVFRSTIKGNGKKIETHATAVQDEPKPEVPKQFNIVEEDITQFSEYDSTIAISKRGRVADAQHAIDEASFGDEEQDFDYETWADAKNAEKHALSESGKHKRRKG